MVLKTFYYTQDSLVQDVVSYPKITAGSWEKALQTVFKSTWMRFTMWEEGSAVRKHYKIIQKKDKWTIQPIQSREFDVLKWTKIKEICTRIPSYPKLLTPSKEMLLDFLDSHLKEAKNVWNKLSILDYLGEFWFEKHGPEITISLKKDAEGRVCNIQETGIIEQFLISIDYAEKQIEELEAEIKSLKTAKRVAETKEGMDAKVLHKLIFERDELKKTVDQLRLNNSGNVPKLTQTVEELTGNLDKISSSFEASERENEKLRKTIKELKAELVVAKAANSILRNELVISKIEPTTTVVTPIEVEKTIKTDSMDPFECY